MTNENSKNINKFISETGLTSRRGADKLIEAGKVKINGKVATLGNRVLKGDTVTVNGKPLQNTTKPVYIAFNKPVGIVCTTDRREKNNIIDFLNFKERIFPIGRLDKLSQGLILLTNDGDIVNKILRARNYHEKEYLVKVDKPINNYFLDNMRKGVPILDQITRRCFVQRLSDLEFKIILTQGLNRQIRRMCEHLGYEVKNLKRVRIMDIKLSDLPKGKWRHLSEREVKSLTLSTKNSEKTSKSA
jgi:23S rRNA pseudouridine2604 synthase